jgi:hypothetical protein
MRDKSIEEKIIEIHERLSQLEKLFLSPENKSATVGRKKISTKEFLMTKNLKSELQKTLVLGYYLEHIEGFSSFNIDDLVIAFQYAKEKKPVNINDVAGKNVARGFFMEAPEKKDSKKAWVLTSTGEKYVEDTINK